MKNQLSVFLKHLHFYFSELIIFVVLFLLLLLVILFPRYNLINDTTVSPALAIKAKYLPGDPILFSSPLDFERLTLNSVPFSSTVRKGKKLWLSGIDISATKGPIIFGQFPMEKSWFPFSHPTIKFFATSIPFSKLPEAPSPKLKISKKTWEKMDDKFAEQKKKERQIMHQILHKSSGPLQISCWQQPVYSKIVSKFGSPRTLPNGASYRHTGLDLRARLGASINAPGKGTVVYRDHMIVPGNLVVLNHGEGIYSRYMHMSKFEVESKSTVDPGTLLGKAGATGRVEGAHLHWEVLWKGARLHPLKFLTSWNEYFCPPK